MEHTLELLLGLPQHYRWRAASRYSSASILHVTAKCSLKCVESSFRRVNSFVRRKGKVAIRTRTVEMVHPASAQQRREKWKKSDFRDKRKRPERMVGTKRSEDASVACVQKLLASTVIFIRLTQLFLRGYWYYRVCLSHNHVFYIILTHEFFYTIRLRSYSLYPYSTSSFFLPSDNHKITDPQITRNIFSMQGRRTGGPPATRV